MKSIFTTVFLLVTIYSFAQDDVGRSTWITAPVKVDGIANEWSSPLRYYDDKSKLSFSFANDNKNLYMCFQTNDAIDQMKILRGGMKINLATKNKHKVSIDFPLQNSDPSQPTKEGEQKTDRRNIKNSFLAENTMMEVKGFATRNGMIPINDSSGIQAAINWDEANKFSYELELPLKELFGNDYTTNDVLKNISLEVIINAVERKKAGSSDNGSGAGRNGGGRMGGGGGRMGGGSGMRGGGMNRDKNSDGEEAPGETMADRTSMFEKSELKEKFVLAQPAK